MGCCSSRIHLPCCQSRHSDGSRHSDSRHSDSPDPPEALQRGGASHDDAHINIDIPFIVARRPTNICETCWKGLFLAHIGLLDRVRPGKKPVSGGFSYTATWANLESRAAEGCRWCQLLVDIRDKDDDSDPDSPIRLVVGSQQCLGGSPKGTQDLSVFIDNTLHFIGAVCTTEEDIAAPHIIARSRILDVGSTRTLALAKDKLQECIDKHEDCFFSPRLRPLLPTRLIDCANPATPWLVPTTSGRGDYVALSYVWGEAQPYSTTQSNLEAYMRAIDPDCLPKTIRDAIQTTHALGLPYLWADTLCIVQDSAEDKLREIALMRNIYRDAYVTIIAASAHRVSEGFLQDRPAVPHNEYSTFARDVVLPFICPAVAVSDQSPAHWKMGEVRVSPLWMYNDPPDQPLVRYDPASEPVSVRGWCMQEHLMSPRALIFASHTLQFHCQTSTHNIGGSYHDTIRTVLLPNALFLPEPPELERGSKAWQEVREAWQTVVGDYTQRSITVSSDKFIAFGGVAEEFRRILRTEYLAGLWRDTLLGDLLWNKRTGTHIPRPAVYRAPSWSWAAVDGHVEAGARDVRASEGHNVAKVVRCEVSLQHPELPFGEVASAVLVIRTPLVQCIWNIGNPNYLYRVRSLPEVVSADDEDDAEVDMERIARGYLDSEDDAQVRGVWVAPVHWDQNIMGGIIVARARHATEAECSCGRYRQVGYFNIYANAGPLDWLEEVPQVDIEVV